MTLEGARVRLEPIETPHEDALWEIAQDPRVNKAESDQIVQSLRKRGVDVEYMVKDNEGHGFSNEENRFAFYEATEAFLAKHLKQKS